VVLVVRVVERLVVLLAHKILQVVRVTRQARRHHRATTVEHLALLLVVLETLVLVVVLVLLVVMPITEALVLPLALLVAQVRLHL
jgi:hypothetical protein